MPVAKTLRQPSPLTAMLGHIGSSAGREILNPVLSEWGKQAVRMGFWDHSRQRIQSRAGPIFDPFHAMLSQNRMLLIQCDLGDE
jgi:hypothetical protein